MSVARFAEAGWMVTGLLLALRHAPAAALMVSDARQIAHDAYLANAPLIAQYRSLREQAVDARSRRFSGGFGHWLHEAPLAADSAEPLADPEVATSSAWVDVRAEPWVLTVPPVEIGRYLACRVTDLRGFVLDNPGTLLDGDAGGNYLLVAPDWSGTLPDGVRRAIKGESSILRLVTVVECMERGDLSMVKKIQRGLKLQPLSAFSHASAPAAAASTDWPAWIEGSERTAASFQYAEVLNSFVRPEPADVSLRAGMERVGLIAGAAVPLARHPAATRAAVTAGVRDAVREIASHDVALENLRNCFGSRRELENDRMCRALAVAAGPSANVATQMVTEAWQLDTQGSPCDGSRHAYRLRFAGGAPPAQYFWSVSVYSTPARRLVANRPGRFALGSHDSRLVPDSTGMLSIEIRHDPPEADRLAAWLPAPAGPFIAVLRVRGPQLAILQATWKTPEMIRLR